MGTLQHIQHQIVGLNELIKANNDRIAGLEKATENTDDTGLKTLFAEYIDQSKANVNELKDYIHVLGGEPADGTTLAGKLSNTWTDVKSVFGTPDRHSVLAGVESGEDVIKAGYRKALDDKELIWEDDKVVALLTGQLDALKTAHDSVKALRDATVNS
ncbi:PA2169 family four-helix-bundle protein [Mucilaginibacter gynuensis]|uniref:PA2169 family four-helix-bundle protein n=1 Tax=Mucilaginibacter gynuensis TaxID=1302236 RepID=A0ABP8HK72_9SPHI